MPQTTPQNLKRISNNTDWAQSLFIGSPLEYDVYDANQVLLLAAGSTITTESLKRITARACWAGDGSMDAQRGAATSTSLLSPHDQSHQVGPLSLYESEVTRQLDDVIAEGFAPKLPAPDHLQRSEARLSLGELREQADEARQYVRFAVAEYANLASDLIKGRNASVHGAHTMVERLMKLIMVDQSLGMLVLNLRGPTREFLFNQGLNTAILSMTVALRLGYEDQQVQDVGVAALFQDVGMLRVPDSILFAPRPLEHHERMIIQSHPIHTINALERARSLGQDSLLASYQAHERCDGSGYPYGRDGMYIHPLAKIIAVVDTFTAMISTRPHRDPIKPYRGMELMLKQVQAQQLDPQVARALLDCTSLFPIGSRVRLSDGTIATVLRSNRSTHTMPVVVPLNADGDETDEELDLSKITSLRVVAALAG